MITAGPRGVIADGVVVIEGSRIAAMGTPYELAEELSYFSRHASK